MSVEYTTASKMNVLVTHRPFDWLSSSPTVNVIACRLRSSGKSDGDGDSGDSRTLSDITGVAQFTCYYTS